jgi:UDP-N-acetyl-D-glucosamine/UDP-N-acetyl-D-galactosamine dehydrogenase
LAKKSSSKSKSKTDQFENVKPYDQVCVIGLGYVGLPVAIEFGRVFKDVVGFDINSKKVKELQKGIDVTGEVSKAEFKSTSVKFTDQLSDLKSCRFFIVAVPTPVDSANVPDFMPLIKASETVGKVLKKGDIVVYESTVYPGATEDVCGPILAKHSGLKLFKDFYLGYSPERINPADKEHTLTKITKVVSGQDARTLRIVSQVYGAIIKAGVHEAPSIKVAEAAKVIENTQRDINIALINELAMVFDRVGIRTQDVLDAAGTKWNFLKFSPGLVGGHCIGVDPYYLTYKAQQLGYHPDVILAGRRINDSVGHFIAQKTMKLLLQSGRSPGKSTIAVFGVTFKEDVTDLRNSKVPGIAKELMDHGAQVHMCDPHADPKEFQHEYGLSLAKIDGHKKFDVIIMAVAHKIYAQSQYATVLNHLAKDGILIDVKSKIKPSLLSKTQSYWSL